MRNAECGIRLAVIWTSAKDKNYNDTNSAFPIPHSAFKKFRIQTVFMRIIAGAYRGRVLKSPPDSRTRPTSDRLRETLFNILASRSILQK